MCEYYDLVYRSSSPPLNVDKAIETSRCTMENLGPQVDHRQEYEGVADGPVGKYHAGNQPIPGARCTEQIGADQAGTTSETAGSGVKQSTASTPEDGKSESVNLCKYLLSMKKDRPKYLIVKTYRGMVYLDIREYFPRDKEYIPTKKGITLSLNEYRAFTMLYKSLDKAIQTGLRNMD